jgi:cell division protein ZapA (FtsZ GTPase activity inhibitor)
MNDKVDIEVFRRKLTVEMEGLTPMEISTLAQKVHDRMSEISDQNNKIADSSKLAILAALFFAAEHEKVRQARSTEQAALERKVEELSLSLRAALTHAGK